MITKPPALPEKYFHTVKEMSEALGRSEDYVGFMKKGGFKLPATLGEAINWIKEFGPVTRYKNGASKPEESKPLNTEH